MKELLRKIESKRMKVAIAGLGYVGLPLAVEFARAGFSVIGVDTDKAKVEKLNKGISYVGDVPSVKLKPLVKRKKIIATQDYLILYECDAVIICVPTPLRKTRDPDISYIIDAVDKIVKYGRNCKIIVLESTTYPGTCEEVILPMLQRNGRKVGKDFFLAFSPERVDPGNKKFTTRNIPKILGGITPQCSRVAKKLYEQSIEKIITVSSATVAEMIKLLENTFRSVNIGLINEIALMCHQMGINVWEVIDGASTKPFAFMPFYPGPGLGGHCLPIDPLYLSWKARLAKFNPKFIELAAEINESMPAHIVSRTADILNNRGKCLNGSKILILGVAYKRDVSDTRESPAIEVINLLSQKGAQISYNDPYVPFLQDETFSLKSVPLNEKNLKKADCVIIVTDHTKYNYSHIIKNAQVIFDTRNATKNYNQKFKNIVKL